MQEVEFQDTDQLAYFSFDEALTAVYQKYSSELSFYPVGTPSMMGQMQGILNQMAVLGTLMVLIFSLLLWVLFRSGSALVWPMVTIALSVAWCWGITVWMGITVSTMVALTVLLIFAVGIADCVHVMSAYFSFRRDGQEHYVALSHAYEKVSLAILLTIRRACLVACACGTPSPSCAKPSASAGAPCASAISSCRATKLTAKVSDNVVGGNCCIAAPQLAFGKRIADPIMPDWWNRKSHWFGACLLYTSPSPRDS